MKIDKPSEEIIPYSFVARQNTKGGMQKNDLLAVPNSTDVAAIGPLASQVQGLAEDARAVSAFDMDKVQAIQKAILNGQFPINFDKTAGGLIMTAKGLWPH